MSSTSRDKKKKAARQAAADFYPLPTKVYQTAQVGVVVVKFESDDKPVDPCQVSATQLQELNALAVQAVRIWIAENKPRWSGCDSRVCGKDWKGIYVECVSQAV